MKLITHLTAVVATAATLATAPGASGATAPTPTPNRARAAPQAQYDRQLQPRERSAAAEAERLRGDRHAVAYFRGKTWNVQYRIPAPRTPTNYVERRWTSHAALHWLKHRWVVRWHKARRVLAAHLPWTNDWATAVRIVQRVWPGTSDWLLRCSSGEGGHGFWVWNGGARFAGTLAPPPGSSGAGGWMQFMRGTFTGTFQSALAEARRLHLKWPLLRGLPAAVDVDGRPASLLARAWISPLMQAFAAGWARYHRATGAWDPGIDPACA